MNEAAEAAQVDQVENVGPAAHEQQDVYDEADDDMALEVMVQEQDLI